MPGSTIEHGGVAFLAVVPAEDPVAAGPHVELDVVGEPLLELLGVGQSLPDLVRRFRKHDLTGDLHCSSDPQPMGCIY